MSQAMRSVDHAAWELLDAAPDAIVVLGVDQRICFVNSQTEALLGYGRNELLGDRLERLVPERFRESHHRHVAQFFAKPGTRAMGNGLELYARRKDGSEIPIEVRLSPVQTSGGLNVCAAIRDITGRKRMEAAAKVNAARLASAVESIEDALALYDADDRLVLCNGAFCELVGARTTAVLIGKRYGEILELWSHSLSLPSEVARQEFCGRAPWQRVTRVHGSKRVRAMVAVCG